MSKRLIWEAVSGKRNRPRRTNPFILAETSGIDHDEKLIGLRDGKDSSCVFPEAAETFDRRRDPIFDAASELDQRDGQCG
jgi:hypothetical protein